MQVNNVGHQQTYNPNADTARDKPRPDPARTPPPPASAAQGSSPGQNPAGSSASARRPGAAPEQSQRSGTRRPSPGQDTPRSSTGARQPDAAPEQGQRSAPGPAQRDIPAPSSSQPAAAGRSPQSHVRGPRQTDPSQRPPDQTGETTAATGNRDTSTPTTDSPAKPDLGPTPTSTIFAANVPSPPNSNYSLQQREQYADAYADRVKTQMTNVETGTEAERNVKALNARPFTTPAGYFSGGLMAAGYDPDAQTKVQFDSYVGMGRPESKSGGTERAYKAWEIAAGALAHDTPAQGGTVNFQSMHIAAADQANVKDLQAVGSRLQDRWKQDVAGPMQDASGPWATRSGKADAYGVQATLQSLQSDKAAFTRLSPDGQQAISRTLNQSGQVIIPNVYGYPLAGHAFIPYKPYDGNYENRPNQGLLVDLNHGAIDEIRGDKDFANWAQKNRGDLLQSFNARDEQGGLDAHWPKAGDVLNDLIAGNNVTYPGYKSLVSDQRIPVSELFNYTRARGSDYQLKYGNLNKDGTGIASQYQAVNAKNAAWADQTQVFDSSAQNWKSAKEAWNSTFGYLPVAGNLGNIVFGAHDSLHGMTAQDRIGGNVGAAISGLQLAHDLAPGAAELAAGQSPSVAKLSGAAGSGWKQDAQTSEFRFQPPQPSPPGPSIPASELSTGVGLSADNVVDTLPGLTRDGQENAMRFLSSRGPSEIPLVHNQEEIDNATKFFNEGGQLGLKGGAGGDDGAGPSRSGKGFPLSQQQEDRIADYVRQNREQTDPDIGRHFGVSQWTVNRIRRSIGMQRDSGKGVYITPEKRTEIGNYILQNPDKTEKEIAAQFNVGLTSIGNIRRAIGAPKAPRNTVRLNNAQRAELTRYIQQNPGQTTREIATRFNVHDSVVARLRYAVNLQGASQGQTGGASTSSAPTAAPAPSSPLLPGLDLDAPLTPGHQKQADEIKNQLGGAPGASAGGQGAGGGESGAAGRDGPPPAKRPRTDAPAAQQPSEPGPSGAPSRPGQKGTAGPAAGTAQNKDVHLTHGKKQEITDYVRQHPEETGADIARRFNVTSSTISAVRHVLGLQKTSGSGIPVGAAKRAEIADYVRQHPDQPSAQVGQRFGVSGPTVRKIRMDLKRQQQASSAPVAGPSSAPSNAPDLQAPSTSGQRQPQTAAAPAGSPGSSAGPSTSGQPQPQTAAAPAGSPRSAQGDGSATNWVDTLSPASTEKLNKAIDHLAGAPPGSPAPAAEPSTSGQPKPDPAAAPAGSPQAPLDDESVLDWLLDNHPPAEVDNVVHALDHIADELSGLSSAEENDEVIGWMQNNLPAAEIKAIELLPGDQFKQKIEEIKQRIEQESRS